MDAPLIFLPVPKSIEKHSGAFVLNSSTAIGRSEQNTIRDRAVVGLIAAITDLTGLTVPINDEGVIALHIVGELSPQHYEIEITSERVELRAGDQAGLFYAVQTLIQIAKNHGRRWPALSIRDHPTLPNRGVMLDVSRGKVPKLTTLMTLVETLAHYKFNQFQLYFEHTFGFPSHPEIGAGADPLTPADIRRLDARCLELHIELIPNLQSIGHQRPLLSLPRFQQLAETDWHWSFASTSDAGFDLLDELYGEMTAAFSSDKFNVNADEPWDFGRGKSHERAAEIGLNRLYLEHIKRLHGLISGHGKKMLMWADMFWHYPELVAELPEDILLLDWWYESKPAYDTVNVLREANREFYICAATSSWSSLYPRLENSIANIRDFTRAGVAAGATGMIVSDWGDNGHSQPLSNSWYAFLLGADAGWTGAETTPAAFDAAFGKLFLRDSSGRQVAALRRLGAAMQTAPDWFTSWHSAMALYEDPIVGKVASFSPVEAVREARWAAEAVQTMLVEFHDAGLRHDLGFATSQIVFAAEKVEATRSIQAVFAEFQAGLLDRDGAIARLDTAIASLRRQAARLPAMKDEFETRWLMEARRSEIRQNLDRFDGLIERLYVSIAWLAEQRAHLAAGTPLDASFASYDRGNYAVFHEATRKQIQELVDIIGIAAIPPDLIPWVEAPSPVL